MRRFEKTNPFLMSAREFGRFPLASFGRLIASIGLLVMCAQLSQARASDETTVEKKSGKASEELTAAALKRVSNQKAKAVKAAKVTRSTKKAPKEKAQDAVSTSEAEAGPIVKTHPVSSRPAPGITADKCDPASEEGCPPKAESTTSAKKEDPSSETSAKVTTKKGGSTVSAETSLKWLGNGNTRFIKRRFRADGRTEKDRLRLVSGELPHAIVLACSDSRVPPELVFDQGLGEIHVVRVAGEILDDSVIASIEAAIENFDAHLLVVLGHTECSTVQQAIDHKADANGSIDGGSESLNKIFQSVQTHLKSRTTEKASPGLQIESTLNADGVARELVTKSEIIRKHVESNDLVIKPALYRLESGKVTFY